MINYKALFDYLSVPWRERGANTSRGHINIRCPWCRDDPSFHLSIHEESGAYRCLRNPNKHNGKSPFYLLAALQLHQDLEPLIKHFSNRNIITPKKSEPKQENSSIERIWNTFEIAKQSPRIISYLQSRGFDNPEQVIDQYDLRYKLTGKYAQRIFFPIYDVKTNQLKAFTGRVLVNNLEPRYYVEGDASYLYVPKIEFNSQNLIIYEGPFDALKTSICYNFTSCSLNGLALSYTKLLQLEHVGKNKNVYLSLDNDQPRSQINDFLSQLRQVLPNTKIASPPSKYKDAGEMPIEELSKWLKDLN